jgi:putative DNA primase/helicase
MSLSRSNTCNAQLERRAREITEAFRGRWRGHKGMCCCPAHDDRTPSLAIGLGKHAILLHCFAGCTSAEVLAAFARHGIEPRELFDGSGEAIAPVVRAQGPDQNALRLWRKAEAFEGSLAARYLEQRGIALHSGELRFHARTPLGHRPDVRFLPAMLAAVRTDEGIVAVHRTFLDRKTGARAAFERPKRALGSLGIGAVRLASPRGGKLGLAEGIENAFSATLLFGIPCWATLGNERFGLVSVPESVRELHLFIDADAGGRLAELKAREAYAVEGRRIVTRRPEVDGQDWNDVLAQRAGIATTSGAKVREPLRG